MSAAHEDRLARVALSRIVEPGHPASLRLVAERGAVFLRDRLLAGVEGDEHARAVAARLAAVDPAGTLEQAHRLGLRFVVPDDEEWPTRLGDLAHVDALHERTGMPLGLWVKGPLRLDTLDESVSVVGARSATTYGARMAGEIACTAARAGWAVVSGAAIGIDQAAHRGALAGAGPSVAVLACGADRIYPDASRNLLQHLGAEHAIISEAAPGMAPLRIRFLARNRLIAALTRGTVVVEAAYRSGALNTATWADRTSRPVMGLPGPVTSPLSQGVHQLLRRGATLVTSGEEVLEHLGHSGDHLHDEPRGEERDRDRLDDARRQVLDAVPVHRHAPVSSIAALAGRGAAAVEADLHALAASGFVEAGPGGWRLIKARR